MKLAVVVNVNGNFIIHTEHEDEQSSIMEFHSYARALWSDKDTKRATLKILDEQLLTYNGYTEYIVHEEEEIENE